MKNQPSVFREIIPTTDSHQENRYFFLTLIGVFWCAALLLWLVSHKDQAPIRLPNQYSNLATQLSIASDEIGMLQDVELISQQPNLSDFIDNELAPFTTENFVKAGINCFVVDKEIVQLRLFKLDEKPWQVQWRSIDSHAHHTDEQTTHSDTLCQAENSWLAVAHLAVKEE